MPPRLADYRVTDWLRLRPVTQGLKMVRYRMTDRRHRQQPARDGDLPHIISAIQSRRVLVTIAFNDPQTIRWQAALIRHYVPHALYVVADNTADDGIAAEIAKSARDAGVFYVRLPANPSRSPSRSHGLALNWVWERIIKPGKPDVFGFLDDDIYPTAPDDPFVALSKQAFYGVVRPGLPMAGPERWFLWAGFSMFRYSAVQDIDLDFSQDWFIGLDTGGGNWEKLYRHVERSSLSEQPTVFVGFRDGVSVSDAPIQWCGPWLNAVGLMGKSEWSADKYAAIEKILEPGLRDAGFHA